MIPQKRYLNNKKWVSLIIFFKYEYFNVVFFIFSILVFNYSEILSVWHCSMLNKALAYGLPSPLCKWITSFLHGRSIQVLVDGPRFSKQPRFNDHVTISFAHFWVLCRPKQIIIIIFDTKKSYTLLLNYLIPITWFSSEHF